MEEKPQPDARNRDKRLMVYDPLTVLTAEQMDELCWWWMMGGKEDLSLLDNEYRGRSIEFSVCADRVWVLPK